MKQIIAMVRPVMRNDVIAALQQVKNFPGACMTNFEGIRRGTCQDTNGHCEAPLIGFRSYIRIEIICKDDMAPALIETIRASARTGKPGDGKIFVRPVESALRISNGQTDEDAI